MDESDSDTSPGDIDDDAPLYPIEGKFTSESDRSRIMAMTEIEREEILAERAAEMEKQQQDRQLKRLLQSRKRDEARNADKKKRKAGAADLDDGDRKTSRQKVKTSAPLEAYKRQRELKGAQRAGFEDRRGRDDRDDRSPSREEAFSDRDAEGESEVEWDEAPRVSSVFKDEPPADLKDFQRVCIGRQNFAVVCFYPTFEEAIKGCFVRVNIGPNRETGQNTYRLCQIKGEYCMVTLQKMNMLTASRLPRRQTIPHGGSEQEGHHHRPVSPRLARQSRKELAICYLLEREDHRRRI